MEVDTAQVPGDALLGHWYSHWRISLILSPPLVREMLSPPTDDPCQLGRGHAEPRWSSLPLGWTLALQAACKCVLTPSVPTEFLTSGNWTVCSASLTQQQLNPNVLTGIGPWSPGNTVQDGPEETGYSPSLYFSQNPQLSFQDLSMNHCIVYLQVSEKH